MPKTFHKNLVVKKSRNGLGIFAAVYIKPGQAVFPIYGTRKHYATLLARGGTFLDNCFRVSEEYYVSPEGYIGMYLNHSCEPNARVVKKRDKLFVYAITKIPAGTEVLIDYSTITAGDDIWTMRCNCGRKACRGLVTNFYKLPHTLREKYKTLHIVPKYITDI